MVARAFHDPPSVIANTRKMFGKGWNGHRHAPARQHVGYSKLGG
ncbi:MAG TPA: hypothetical protein VF219_02315 [Vicinamibacterales bacterium]